MRCQKCHSTEDLRKNSTSPKGKIQYLCVKCNKDKNKSSKRLRQTKEYRIAHKEYQRRARNACLEILGGKCSRCGFSDSRALQVDHVGGGGAKELKKITGARYYKRVIDSVLNKENKYQLLCANCNWIKRSENKEFKKLKY